jgi:protein involved in polysaccharide export with SLBB domain
MNLVRRTAAGILLLALCVGNCPVSAEPTPVPLAPGQVIRIQITPAPSLEVRASRRSSSASS